MKGHTCPVCAWPELRDPPRTRGGGASYEICPSCGFEFGVSDEIHGATAASWRAAWVARGRPWSSIACAAPAGWDPQAQLAAGGLA